jgi:hypothetical protein
MSLNDVATEFNICNPTVSKILNKYNIKRYKKAEIFNPEINENYFSIIDTQNKAYFLGLIIADGNIFKTSKGNRQDSISITLQDEDIYILNKFKEELRINTHINSDGRGSSTIAVRSNKMSADLEKYGINERKSFNTSLPYLDETMMPHLIRGIMDGDGSVQAYQTDNKNRYKHSIGFCGTELLMNQIKDYLTAHLDINIPKVYTYKTRTLSMVTWVSISDMHTILEYLYNDAETYLIRKRNKYEDFKSHYNL